MALEWLGMALEWLWSGFQMALAEDKWRIHAEKWVRSAKTVFSLRSTLEEGAAKVHFQPIFVNGGNRKLSPKASISQRF
jgi:hypothetical protein